MSRHERRRALRLLEDADDARQAVKIALPNRSHESFERLAVAALADIETALDERVSKTNLAYNALFECL